MLIYIISLKSDLKRRNRINNLFIGKTRTYNFFDAIIGKKIKRESLPCLKGRIKYRKNQLTNGEIGCTFSHLEVYKLLLNSNQDWICVLEDDVEIDNKFFKFIDNVQQENLNVNGVYFLGITRDMYETKFIAHNIWGKEKHVDSTFYLSKGSGRFIFGTYGYLISRNSAKKLIELHEKGFYLADDWKAFEKEIKDLRYYIIESNIVNHPPLNSGNSNIDQERKGSYKPLSNFSLISRPFKSLIYYIFKLVNMVR